MGWQQEGSCVIEDDVELLLRTSDVNLGECGRVYIINCILYCMLDSAYDSRL